MAQPEFRDTSSDVDRSRDIVSAHSGYAAYSEIEQGGILPRHYGPLSRMAIAETL